MIDERKEEQASIYVLGLMEPHEAQAFESELRTDAELRKFVDDLQRSSAAMVHAVPAKAAPSHLKEKILSEIRAGKTPEISAAKSNDSNKVIPFFRPIVWLPWAMAAGLMVMCGWLYSDRIRLKEQLDASENKKDVCEIQLAMLAPTNGNTHGSATIAWDSSMQTGVITGQNMTRPAANEDYQLWILDDQYQHPVDAGVVSVDDNGTMKTTFQPKQKVSDKGKFAISVEPKGGMPQPSGPIMMVSGSKQK